MTKEDNVWPTGMPAVGQRAELLPVEKRLKP
jgi:hypothetical protein